MITPEVFTAVTLKGNQIQPTEPDARLRGLSIVNAATWLHVTARESDSRTVEHNFHHIIRVRPGAQAKPKSDSQSRDLSRHVIIQFTSPGDMIAKN